MLAIYVIITVVTLFISGMHYALYDNFGIKKNLYWSFGLGVIGIYDIISMIGYVAKHAG